MTVHPDLKGMKVAIVHDWFVGGGAEQVVEQIHKLFPKAPIYTAYCSDEWRARLSTTTVHTSYMQHWPFSVLRKFLPPLRQHWFSHLDFSNYDLVISSSGAEAKGIRVPKSALHINYCHAPTHYYWSRYQDYLHNPGFGAFNWLARAGLSLLLRPMRRWDYKAAQRPDYIVANSNHIKEEILKYYHRESVVIHPPVQTDEFTKASRQQRSGFITSGRQTPYKRIDLAVQACSDLNLPLLVLGDGPEHARLQRQAGPSVRFQSYQRQQAPELIGQAEAFIFPGLDDFGISAVEALAAGTPLIAYQAGGALDYVEPGKTGLFFKPQTAEALGKVLQNFSAKKFDYTKIRQAAQTYRPERFRDELSDFINHVWGQGHKS